MRLIGGVKAGRYLLASWKILEMWRSFARIVEKAC